jgi:hypothetical protein
LLRSSAESCKTVSAIVGTMMKCKIYLIESLGIHREGVSWP